MQMGIDFLQSKFKLQNFHWGIFLKWLIFLFVDEEEEEKKFEIEWNEGKEEEGKKDYIDKEALCKRFTTEPN